MVKLMEYYIIYIVFYTNILLVKYDFLSFSLSFLLIIFLSIVKGQGKAYEMTKFDTDDVEKYPIFSIDLYNCQIPRNHDELSKYLESAVLGAFPSKKSKEVEKVRGTETESGDESKGQMHRL